MTGSLIIRYDRERLTPPALWRALCERHIVWGPSPIEEDAIVTLAEVQAPTGPSPAASLVDTVVGVLVDKLAARSAALLLGALI